MYVNEKFKNLRPGIASGPENVIIGLRVFYACFHWNINVLRFEFGFFCLAVDRYASQFPECLLEAAPANYESNITRFVKASQIIPEAIIKREGTLISVYRDNGELLHMGIASPDQIDFAYETEYIRRRNLKTRQETLDGASIIFEDLNDRIALEDEDECFGIRYQSFLNSSYSLNHSDDLVFASSDWKPKAEF